MTSPAKTKTRFCLNYSSMRERELASSSHSTVKRNSLPPPGASEDMSRCHTSNISATELPFKNRKNNANLKAFPLFNPAPCGEGTDATKGLLLPSWPYSGARPLPHPEEDFFHVGSTAHDLARTSLTRHRNDLSHGKTS